MSFFDEQLTKEDFLLYVIVSCLSIFLGWYLFNSQEELLSTIDYRMDHIKTEEVKVLEAAKMRYEFAGKVLISNSTRINLGFLVGSVMCLLGTILEIKKARVELLEASGGDNKKNISFSFKTNSPGIFLALLGTLIITLSIVVKDKYQITDNDYIKRNMSNSEVQQANDKVGVTGNEPIWNK